MTMIDEISEIQATTGDLLTAKQVAGRTGLSELTVRLVSLTPQGPPTFELAGRTVWPSDQLQTWLRDNPPWMAVRWLGEWLTGSVDRRPGDEADAPDSSRGLVECLPWCVDRNGHPDETYRDDQRCFGEELSVDLSLHREIPEARLDERTGNWHSAPDSVKVYAERTPDQDVQVHLQRGDGPEVRYTVGEAQQLVEALHLVLGQVGQVDHP